MSTVTERQMDKTAPLILALVRQDQAEFGRHAFPHQRCEPLKTFGQLVGPRYPRYRMMDDRTVDMIIESHSKQLATRVTEAKDAEAKRQRSRDRHQKQSLRLWLLGLTQAVAYALFQSGRHRHFAHGSPQPPAHVAALLCLLCAGRAAPEMLDHFEIAFRQQFIVDVRIEVRSKLLARLPAKSCFSHNLSSF